jgi:hypothetical protein
VKRPAADLDSASATEMLATLLDRSVERIATLAADGRDFDRFEVVRTADVWDNNTSPFFAAAVTRLPWLRERRARTALRWMGAFRSDWMTSLAGPAVERFLGPTPTRTEITEPPDLTGATVAYFALDRAGPTFTGLLRLRRENREVEVRLNDVRTVSFDGDDTVGVTVSDSRQEIRLGAHGVVTAASMTFGDDHVPASPKPAEPHVRIPGQAGAAAFALHQAMIKIRTVRYAGHVGRLPLPGLCDALANAGTRTLAAAAASPASKPSSSWPPPGNAPWTKTGRHPRPAPPTPGSSTSATRAPTTTPSSATPRPPPPAPGPSTPSRPAAPSG